ncbi:DUF3939 domain-containing protein [Citrobacter portucalensis]|nr:DUF3939 domain-containing protein [Citrobacter portucalensis]
MNQDVEIQLPRLKPYLNAHQNLIFYFSKNMIPTV